MSLKHAHMGVSRTAARSPLNTWQPDQMHLCRFRPKMPKWAWTEQLRAPRPDSQITSLTARSRLCGFRANMPLKHANMDVSRTAAPSLPWQPDHVCADFEQTCQHMGVSSNSCTLLLNSWQPDHIYAVFEQTCHLNMPKWAWAEQLHAPHWIPDSQIKSMQFSNKHAT